MIKTACSVMHTLLKASPIVGNSHLLPKIQGIDLQLQICQDLPAYQMIEKSGEALYLGGCGLQHWAEIRDIWQSNLALGMSNESNDGMME